MQKEITQYIRETIHKNMKCKGRLPSTKKDNHSGKKLRTKGKLPSKKRKTSRIIYKCKGRLLQYKMGNHQGKNLKCKGKLPSTKGKSALTKECKGRLPRDLQNILCMCSIVKGDHHKTYV